MNNVYIITNVFNWSEFGDIFVVTASSETEALEILLNNELSKFSSNSYMIENARVEKIDLNLKKVVDCLLT